MSGRFQSEWLVGLNRNGWSLSIGMAGRIESEWVVAFNRNGWSLSIGMAGRSRSESVSTYCRSIRHSIDEGGSQATDTPRRRRISRKHDLAGDNRLESRLDTIHQHQIHIASKNLLKMEFQIHIIVERRKFEIHQDIDITPGMFLTAGDRAEETDLTDGKTSRELFFI
jgi:hypothetical protein